MKCAIGMLILSLIGAGVVRGQWLPEDPPKGPFNSCIGGKLVTQDAPPPSILGINYAITDKTFVRMLRLPVHAAAYVTAVSRGSAAESAGIRQGDVIMKIGKKAIKSACDLPSALIGIGKGSSVPMTIWRDKAQLSLRVNF